MDIVATSFGVIAILLVVLGGAYAIARVASIAHFRTREEFERKSFWKLLKNGEDDAKSE